MAATASHKVSVDSGSAVHVMRNVSVNPGKAVLLDISIAVARKDNIKAAPQNASIIRLPGR